MIKLAIKTSDLGGADWADGDIGYAADFNDTFGAVTTHLKQFSSASEFSTDETTFQDVTTFTLSIPVNSLIISLRFKCEMLIANDQFTADVAFKIDGTNLGTKYIIPAPNKEGTMDIGTVQSTIFQTGESGYQIHAVQLAPALKILDSSTSLTPQLKTSTTTARIKSIEVDVVYVEIFKED